MLEQDATAACGERHERGERRQAHRWGRTKGKIGFHGGKVEIERPRVRGLDRAERVLPSWENAVSEDLLGKWAMNQMLINVSTRRFKRSVRLPEGDVPASDGAGLSKSATSRRFVEKFLADNPDMAEKQYGDAMAASLSRAFPCPGPNDEAGEWPVTSRLAVVTTSAQRRFRD